MRSLKFLAPCLLFMSAAGPLAPVRRQAHASDWLTDRALAEQLATPFDASWTNLPLSRALKNLGTAQRLAIVLDRRIDPDRPISLTVADEPLAEGLKKLAAHLEIGYCQWGPIAYFGPPTMARRLRTLAALRLDDVRSLPPAAQRKFLLIRSWHWNDLAEPRGLVEELAAEAGVVIKNLDKIPHDLWPAADLPPLSWLDRLTLVTAQFDLTFSLDKSGQQVELVAMPENVALSRTYQAPPGAVAIARRWAKAVPRARVTVEKNRIRLDGLLEDHELVESRLRGKPTQRTTLTPGKEVYQLSVENAALSRVVDQVGTRLNVQFHWDRAAIDTAGISLDQLVSVKVQNASLDELLRAVLAGTGLAFARDDRAVRIFPADK